MLSKLSDKFLITTIVIFTFLSISVCFYFIVDSKRNEPEQAQKFDSDTESTYVNPFLFFPIPK